MDRLIVTNLIYLFKKKSLIAFIGLAFFGEFVAIGVLGNYLQDSQASTLATLWISLIVFCNAILGAMIGLSLFKTVQTVGIDNITINLGYSRRKVIFSKFITFFMITFVLSIFLSLFAMVMNATTLSNAVIFTGFLLGSIISISLSAFLTALLGLFFKNIVAVIIPVTLTGFLMIIGSLVSPKPASYHLTTSYISLTKNGDIDSFSGGSEDDSQRFVKLIANPMLSLDYIYLLSAPTNVNKDRDIKTTRMDTDNLFKIKINGHEYITVFPDADKETFVKAQKVIANLNKRKTQWTKEIKKWAAAVNAEPLFGNLYTNAMFNQVFSQILITPPTGLDDPKYKEIKATSSGDFDKIFAVLLVQNGYLDVTNYQTVDQSNDKFIFESNEKHFYNSGTRVIPRYVYVLIYSVIIFIMMGGYFIFYRRKDFKN